MLVAERARLDLEAKAASMDGKREQDSLNRRAKEYTNELKRCKRAEVQLQTSLAQVPFMRRQQEETNRQLQMLHEEGKKQRAAMEELKREVRLRWRRHDRTAAAIRCCAVLLY